MHNCHPRRVRLREELPRQAEDPAALAPHLCRRGRALRPPANEAAKRLLERVLMRLVTCDLGDRDHDLTVAYSLERQRDAQVVFAAAQEELWGEGALCGLGGASRTHVASFEVIHLRCEQARGVEKSAD